MLFKPHLAIRTQLFLCLALLTGGLPSKGWTHNGTKYGTDTPVAAEDLVFVFDLDDTNRILGLGHHSFVDRLRIASNFVLNQAFVGMPEIVTLLHQRHPVYYVTAAPHFLRPHIKNFFAQNRYPLLSSEQHLYTRSISSDDKIVHKVKSIKAVIDRHPAKKVVLILDNGELDQIVAEILFKDPHYGPRIKAVYIHTLYDRLVEPHWRDTQIPYYTSVDLALRLTALGGLLEPEYGRVLRTVHWNLNSTFPRAVERVFPYFSSVGWPSVAESLDFVAGYKFSQPDLQAESTAYRMAFEERMRWRSRTVLYCRDHIPTP